MDNEAWGGILMIGGLIIAVGWCFTSIALPFLFVGLVLTAGGIWIATQTFPGLIGLISGLLLVGSLTFDWGARVNWLAVVLLAVAVFVGFTYSDFLEGYHEGSAENPDEVGDGSDPSSGRGVEVDDGVDDLFSD